jgi:hypothetical protein
MTNVAGGMEPPATLGETTMENVSCGWAPATTYLDDILLHKEHDRDMSRCDAWVCPCGNDTDTGGFVYVNGAHEDIDDTDDTWFGFRCDRCNRIIDKSGAVVLILTKVKTLSSENCKHNFILALNYNAGDVECSKCGALWERRR